MAGRLWRPRLWCRRICWRLAEYPASRLYAEAGRKPFAGGLMIPGVSSVSGKQNNSGDKRGKNLPTRFRTRVKLEQDRSGRWRCYVVTEQGWVDWPIMYDDGSVAYENPYAVPTFIKEAGAGQTARSQTTQRPTTDCDKNGRRHIRHVGRRQRALYGLAGRMGSIGLMGVSV